MSTTSQARTGLRQTGGFWLGLVLALGMQLVGPPEALGLLTENVPATPRDAWIVLSLLALMAVWWVSEALPIAVTALLPMVVLPFFGVASIREAAAPYMHPIVVLLMGGFIIAKAIEKWGLHKRIALNIVVRAGSEPRMLLAGFMTASALLSMWISNTATSIMMTPIALSVAGAAALGRRTMLAPALLLGVAYSCSVGGLGTPIGSPTNLIVIGYLREAFGMDIGFFDWMQLGLPTVLLIVPAGWFVLSHWVFKFEAGAVTGAGDRVRAELEALGAITEPEKRVLGVFALVAGLWVFRQVLDDVTIAGVSLFGGLTDQVTAILGVVLMFIVPAGQIDETGREVKLLDWPSAEAIPWGVVLLFGGGMSLATAITDTQLGSWLGGQMSGLASLPPILLIACLTLFVISVTEVTSNIATASALMPVLAALAASTGVDVAILAAPLALAASCAFMLPMSTGPNAVVFATGQLTIPQMMAAGVRLNVLAVIAITGVSYLLATSALS